MGKTSTKSRIEFKHEQQQQEDMETIKIPQLQVRVELRLGYFIVPKNMSINQMVNNNDDRYRFLEFLRGIIYNHTKRIHSNK